MALFGLFHRDKSGNETPIEIDTSGQEESTVVQSSDNQSTTLLSAQTDPVLSNQIKQLQADLAAERADRAKREEMIATEAKNQRIQAIKTAGASYADKAVLSAQIFPAGRDALANLHSFVALSAAGLPIEGIDASASLDKFVKDLPSHGLFVESVSAEGKLPEDLQFLARNLGQQDLDAEARKINDALFGAQGVAPVTR